MRTKYLVIVAVTILSVLAAVAIAGVPSSGSADPDAFVPPESTTTLTSTTALTTPSTAPDDEETVPTTDATPPDTDPPATEPAVSDPPATEPPDTGAPTTEVEASVDRDSLEVVVVNGAAVGGVARETADELIDLGYVNVRTTDGAEIVEASAVFTSPGLDAEARRLATDLGINPSLVFPVSAIPDLISPVDADLVVYLGIDVADR